MHDGNDIQMMWEFAFASFVSYQIVWEGNCGSRVVLEIANGFVVFSVEQLKQRWSFHSAQVLS